MNKFQECLNLLKENIKTMMTKENLPDEELNSFVELNKQVDELGKQHQELVESNAKMKDKYIEAITNYGTSDQNKEDKTEVPKTLEEIAQAVAKRDSNK